MMQAPAQVTAHQALEIRQYMKDGIELLVRIWLPALDTGKPRGTVILVHGTVEHSGCYLHVAKVLTDLGLHVRAFDLRGHGKSDDPRMVLDAQDNYLTDLAEIVDAAVAEWHEMPFMLDHNMGGLIVAHFTTARIRPVHGVLLSSPVLRVKLSFGAGIMRGLLSVLTPKPVVPGLVDPAKLLYDLSIAAAYRADPLVQGTISASPLEFMLNVITQAQQGVPRLEMSTLLMAGGANSIADPSGSRGPYVNAPEGLRTLAWFDSRYHEVFNEVEPLCSEMFGKMTEWLASRI